MGENNNGSVCFKDYCRGLENQVQSSSSINFSGKLHSASRDSFEGSSLNRGSKFPFRKRGYRRVGLKHKTRIVQQSLPCPKEDRWFSTNFKFKTSKSVFKLPSFQDGKLNINHTVSEKVGMGCVFGSIRRLLTCSNAQG